MKTSDVAKNSVEFVKANSPAILTGIGAGGVVATGILAAKGGMRAQQLIWEDESRGRTPEDTKERLKHQTQLTWKCYIPAASVGVSTVAAIIGANTISSRRNAAIVSLYSVTDAAFKEYKAKVVETIGEKKNEEVLDEIAKEKVAQNPPPNASQVIIGKGDVLTYDSLTGRYFMCDIETIRKAQNDINARCVNDTYASQNDFYQLIGLPPTTFGEEVGWTSNNMMEINFTSVLAEDGRPCLVINYQMEPTRGFYKSYKW